MRSWTCPARAGPCPINRTAFSSSRMTWPLPPSGFKLRINCLQLGSQLIALGSSSAISRAGNRTRPRNTSTHSRSRPSRQGTGDIGGWVALIQLRDWNVRPQGESTSVFWTRAAPSKGMAASFISRIERDIKSSDPVLLCSNSIILHVGWIPLPLRLHPRCVGSRLR